MREGEGGRREEREGKGREGGRRGEVERGGKEGRGREGGRRGEVERGGRGRSVGRGKEGAGRVILTRKFLRSWSICQVTLSALLTLRIPREVPIT